MGLRTPVLTPLGEVMEDPLKALLLDAVEANRARLAQALHDVLGVDTKSGGIVLKPGFNSLDTGRRVLAYLLGALAAKLLDLRETEEVQPIELQQRTGMPKGTVNPKLSQLHKDRRVSKGPGGAYFVAGHQIDSAVQYLLRDEEAD